MDLLIKTIEIPTDRDQSLILYETAIPGVTPIHHAIMAGSSLEIPSGDGKHHILTLAEGTAVFVVAGKELRFDERVTVIPGLDQPTTVRAETTLQVMEI